MRRCKVKPRKPHEKNFYVINSTEGLSEGALNTRKDAIELAKTLAETYPRNQYIVLKPSLVLECK